MRAAAKQSSLFKTPKEQSESKADEFYATPAHIVHQLLSTATELCDDDTRQVYRCLPGWRWVDPGCGTGAITLAVLGARPSVEFVAIETRQSALDEFVLMSSASQHDRVLMKCANWLAPIDPDSVPLSVAEVVVMNSPFCDRTEARPYPGLTHRFVQAAFDHCPDAWVWSLQRQSWRAQRSDRAEWLAAHHPEFILQCTGKRPSFGGTSGTDSCEYEWCGWSPTGRDRCHARYAGFCK